MRSVLMAITLTLFFSNARVEFPLRIVELNVAVDDGTDAAQADFIFATPPQELDATIDGEFAPSAIVVPFAMGGMSFMPQDTLGIASFPQFADELQIVDDQRTRLRDLHREIGKARHEMIQSLHTRRKENGGGTIQDGRKMHEMMMAVDEKIQATIEERINEVLLPHQIKRLEELKFQMQIRNQGAPAVAGGKLAKVLDLTVDQRLELREKEQAKMQELNEQIAKLREEARQEILDEVLTDAQQAKLAELTGDKYEPKRPERPNRFFERVDQRSSRDDNERSK